jgi:membrane protease YdiL (CAAX protease family)
MMKMPDWPCIVFLCYLLIFLPWLAFRSGRRFRAAMSGKAPDSPKQREAIWYSTIISQSLMFAMAWLAGGTFGFQIFAWPRLSPNHFAAAAAALIGLLTLRAVVRATRSEDERRNMVVYYLAPRSSREWRLKGLTVLVASISEEASYRGVGFAILWFSVGSALIAALICSIAFAAAHSIQGWKSMLVIFSIAIVMHALVYYTETLVLAMIVHAIYDFIAIFSIYKESLRLNLGRPT